MLSDIQKAKLERLCRMPKMEDGSKFHDSFKLDDVEGPIGVMSVKVLSAVAKGEIDLNDVAKFELANRGLDKNGKWVGFDRAWELFCESL